MFRCLKWSLVFFLTGLVSLFIIETIEPSRISHPRIVVAFSDLEQLRHAIELYKDDHSTQPPHSVGLEALLPTDSNPGYLMSVPRDPWGNEYLYLTSRDYLVYSRGLNGIDERGSGDDVTVPDKEYSCQEYGIGCPVEPVAVLRISAMVTILTSATMMVVLLAAIFVRYVRS